MATKGSNGRSKGARSPYKNGETPQEFPLNEIARGDVQVLGNPGEKEPWPNRGREQQYEDFFRLAGLILVGTRCSSLQAGLDGTENGLFLLPLGFVPGPAALLKFLNGKVRAVSSTDDVKKEWGIPIPTEWGTPAELPEKIRQAMENWQSLVTGLGCEPSPWAMGFAQSILEGSMPRNLRFLAMGLSDFHWGGMNQPLGMVLTPVAEGEFEIAKVFNPENLDDVPAVGTRIVIEELQLGGKNPLAKLLRTWAKMESAFQRTKNR